MDIQKAGAIVTRVSNTKEKEMLLVHRERKNDWSFPKGHVEENETSEAAAIREVKEETGEFIELLKELPSLKYPGPEGQPIECKMYLAKVIEDAEPIAIEAKGTAKWTAMNTVEETLTYPNLKEYFRLIRSEL